MGNQVDFQKARRRPLPVIVGTYRNPFSHRLFTPASAPAARDGTDRFQETVQGGCTGAQQPTPYLGVESEVAMALHGLHQVR